MKKKLNIGLIGHKFMGKAHSHALRDISMFFELDSEPVMHTLCGIGEDLEATARRYGWQRHTQSWEDVIGDPDIDIVDVCTPGNTHCEIVTAAARAGKHVLCEKPLALNADEALQMYRAAETAGVRHLVNFNYRRVPAVALAKALTEEGRLGTIYHFRAVYQQDWPLDAKFPYLWRFDKTVAGAGSMADKGSHIVDLARYLVGEIDEVAAANEIFVKHRPVAGSPGARKEVTTDDAAVFIARLAGGAMALFLTSRMSAGHKNCLAFEVNGSQGSLMFDLERMNELEVYFRGEQPEGFRTVMVTDAAAHRYIQNWWPPGHVLGWEHTFVHQYYEFLQGIMGGCQPAPSFLDGLRNQEVLDAIEVAAREKRWVAVSRAEAAG